MLTLGVQCKVTLTTQGGKVANVGDGGRGGGCDRWGGLRRMVVRGANVWGIKMGKIAG